MGSILRTTPQMGQVLYVRDYHNHIVLRRLTEPSQQVVEFNWTIQAPDGSWQVGFILKSPIRRTSHRDGTPAKQGPLRYFHEVVGYLERLYGGVQILQYLNPSHPEYARAGAATKDLVGRTLGQLVHHNEKRRIGGRSKSDAKMKAAQKSLKLANEAHNETVGWLANNRWERLEHYRELGLTHAEIAEKEGCSPASVKQALYRSRKYAEKEAVKFREERETRRRENPEDNLIPLPRHRQRNNRVAFTAAYRTSPTGS